MASESCANAVCSAPAARPHPSTLAIPTDEPSRAGLTNSGKPSSATLLCGGVAIGLVGKLVDGAVVHLRDPCSAMSCLNVTLFMHSAEARTPAPT